MKETKSNSKQEQKMERNGNKRTAVFLALGMAALEAGAGAIGGAAKVAGKVVEHGADNAAEHVLTHQADEFAEAGAKGAAKALAGGGAHWGAKGGALEKAVEGASMAARAERKGIRATTVLAAGGAAAALDAAHNLSKGSRNRNEALGDAEKRAIEEHPELVAEIRGEENRWKNIAAGGVAVALLAVALPFAFAAAGAGRAARRGLGALLRRRSGKNGAENGARTGKTGKRGLVRSSGTERQRRKTEEQT